MQQVTDESEFDYVRGLLQNHNMRGAGISRLKAALWVPTVPACSFHPMLDGLSALDNAVFAWNPVLTPEGLVTMALHTWPGRFALRDNTINRTISKAVSLPTFDSACNAYSLQ